MNYSKNNIHTGKMLQDYFIKNRVVKDQLGRDINRNGKSVGAFVKNASIQTGILIEICYALKHNFFQDIANKLPKDFSVDKNLDAENQNSILQILEENKVLKIQNELLMRLKG
jgi:hypothetical protein